MTSPIPASLVTILPVIQTQLATATGLPSTVIHWSARNRIPRLRSDQDILLRPGPVSWDKGFDGGSGRVCAIIRRPLLVTVRVRCNVDMSDDDLTRLTDPALGLIPLEESVANALLDFVPQDASENMLVQEPMHPVDSPEEQTADGGYEVDWAESRLAFLLTYQLPLNQAASYG